VLRSHCRFSGVGFQLFNGKNAEAGRKLSSNSIWYLKGVSFSVTVAENGSDFCLDLKQNNYTLAECSLIIVRTLHIGLTNLFRIVREAELLFFESFFCALE